MAPKKQTTEPAAATTPADDVSMADAPLDEQISGMDGPIDPFEQRIRIVSFYTGP